jgi:hypothetical protein
VTITSWNLSPRLPDSLFAFTPPQGATRVDVEAFAPRTTSPSTPPSTTPSTNSGGTR